MGRHTEPLNLGLFTAEDPGLLQEGQLPVIVNGVYRPGKQALQRISGRTVFGAATATSFAVEGLRDAKFDNGNHYLIAHVSASYTTALVGDTGTFGVLTSAVGVGSQLEAVHYRNRFFLFNGVQVTAENSPTAVNGNAVLYLSATAAATTPTLRQHGMNPVRGMGPTATAAGAWSITDTGAVGYYEYWATEVAKFTQDGADFSMESTYDSTTGPVTVNITSTAVVPIIRLPTIANPGVTTNWRIYRSPKKDKESDKKFPTGFMIAEIGVASGTAVGGSSVTAIADTLTVSTTAAFPGNFNGVGDGATVFASMGAQASALASDNNVDGTMQSTGLTDIKIQGVYGFNFGGFSGSVRGITVEVEALVNTGTSVVGVTIVRKRKSDGGYGTSSLEPALRNVAGETFRKLNTATKTFIATTARTVHSLGGANDRWFASDNPNPLSDTDFGTDFMVTVGFADSATTTLSVDYVKVTVHYGATIDSVIPFPTVVYTFSGTTAQVGKNGPPPTSDTGDIYEDTLVTNDKSNPGLIRYSYPGDPEAYPATYYIDFETRENDQVRLIKVTNNRLVVGLDSSLWRVNYLPSERDASFDRGKCIEPISRSFGVVNPMCACIVSIDGSQEKLAFVSHKGVHATDGYGLESWTDGLDWRGVISLTSTSAPICLVNDPEKQRVVFFYRNDALGGSETYMALEFNYASEHLVNGKPKVSGPWVAGNWVSDQTSSLESAWVVPRSTGTHSLYLGYGSATAAGGGSVYRENGTALPIENPTMRYRTRELSLAGLGSEWRSDSVHLYLGGNSAAVTASAQAYSRKTNDDTGLVAGDTSSVTFNGRRYGRMWIRQGGEAIQYSVTASGAVDHAHHFLVIDGQDFGIEDSGK